jgi:NADPH:quinone reductase-like Zn-dependent oxidoreductase
MPALLIREFGQAAAVLELGEMPDRPLSAKELRVKILASPINPADLNWIEGTYGTRPELPEVPGTEAVGEVVESRDSRFPVGARVMFLGYAHGWQSQRIVAAEDVMMMPHDVAIEELAMLKVNPATAWRMLHDFTKLRPGDVIVQNAANSAVGCCVIQIARALGVATINMVRRAELIEELQDLGADLVCLDDDAGKSAALDFLAARGQRAALALNAVGGESALRQLDLLEDGATQVTYGAMGRRPLTVPNKFLIFRDIRFCGFWLSLWLNRATAETIATMYAELLEMIREGKLRQVVDSVHDLTELPQALERLQAADRRGKVLFAPR